MRLPHVAWTVTAVVAAAAIGVVAASFVGAKLAFPIRVTSNSMAPYAHIGDYGIALHGRDVRHDDVIAFHFPPGSPSLAIKRAAILPGECMPPLGGGAAANAVNLAVSPGTTCTVVPKDAVFVLGDNIGGSVDSRHFGAVPAGEVVGKVVLMLPVSGWLARLRGLAGPILTWRPGASLP